jgi:dTMP kinase
MPLGKYIVIEGPEGGGKTLQAELLYNYLLRDKKIQCHFGREPGGIKAAEEMRAILKHNSEDICAEGELFGFEFARAEFFDKIVIPKLNQGINVISDRSGYSTEAYQGYGGGLNLEWIRLMNHIAMRGIQPDLAFIIDINPKIGLAKEVVKDRISARGFYEYSTIPVVPEDYIFK